MNDEIIIIDKQIDQMADIFNAVPGEVFRVKDIDTLLIVQRRLVKSDLLSALSMYNEIFSKSSGADIKNICQSAIAYVRIKTLVESEQIDFDGKSIRQLIREYRNQMNKINNIIHLTKVNAMTAESYQRDAIQTMMVKNEAFLESFQKEIDIIEKQIERMPKEEVKEVVVEGKHKEENATERVQKQPGIVSKVGGVFQAKRQQKETEDKLREEEKRKSLTKCVEIPFYDKSLTYSEVKICKDIPAFSIMTRKNNVYFGLSKNVEKGNYNNQDNSLLELTEATKDFVQYMTADILSGEYDLKPFTNEDKESLQMYFEFVSGCFEKNIGIILTVQEYLKFKNYYNRVVLTMFELEEQFRTDYYRALVLADKYITYMNCYSLSHSDEKKLIVKNIMNEKSRNYMEDLELILAHHIVDKKAKDVLIELIDKIKHFSDDNNIKPSESNNVVEANNQKKEKSNFTGYADPTPESLDIGMGFLAEDYNDESIVTADDLSHIQIKIQFKNHDHVIVDEALFAASNVKKAVFDYLNRDAFIKKIGLYMNGKDVCLFSSKNSSLSVPVLTEQMKRIKRLNVGTQGELIEFYEDKIRKTMIELTE